MKNIFKDFLFVSCLMLFCLASFSQKNDTAAQSYTKDSVTKNEFNEYVQNSFHTFYEKYFIKACDSYFKNVKFNIDQKGLISNVVIENSPDYIANFMKDVLLYYNQKRLFTFWGDDLVTKKIVTLPVYFNFTDNCSDTLTQQRSLNLPQPRMETTFYKNGFMIDKETKDSIFLSPIVFNGPFIHRNAFDKYYKNKK